MEIKYTFDYSLLSSYSIFSHVLLHGFCTSDCGVCKLDSDHWQIYLSSLVRLPMGIEYSGI